MFSNTAIPAPLQQIADRYNDLVQQFNDGHITEHDAMSLLAATSVTDGDGAVWGIAAQGHFVRAPQPGDPAQPADPATYVDPATPRPPAPAFPAPSTMFTQPLTDLDAPPPTRAMPAQDWSHSGPAIGPILPTNEPAAATHLTARPGPKVPPAILAKIGGFLSRNRVFVIILAIGAIVLAAALIVPNLTQDEPTAKIPATAPALPGEEMPADAPPVTSQAPTALDAAAVATTLQSGTPEQIQALLVPVLDAPTLLRTQALWAGAAQLRVTISPQPAAAIDAVTATQKWVLTRADQTEPVTTIDVTWTNDGTTWKLTAPPTF